MKLVKNKANAKQQHEAEVYYLIIGDSLKNVQKQVRLFKWGYMINGNENEARNEK